MAVTIGRVAVPNPPVLLDSQLETLEPPGADEAAQVEAVGTPEQTARAVLEVLGE